MSPILPAPAPPPEPQTLGQVPQSAVLALPRPDPSAIPPPPSTTELPPQQQYDAAMRLLRAGDYAGAEGGLRLFLELNPDHALAANAAYWLAETYYVRKNYAAAAAAFARNYQTYGKDAAKSLRQPFEARHVARGSGREGQGLPVLRRAREGVPERARAHSAGAGPRARPRRMCLTGPRSLRSWRDVRSAGSAPSSSDPPAASPLDETRFAALMAALGPFERRPRLAVAVSGGPDSLALCLLAERWAQARGGATVGLIVDHGLRPESAREAGQVAAWLSARGIAQQVLSWQGAKPASGIQAAARAARYELLCAWCRAAGVLHLLTAHHRDDQAETVALRQARGSGADGLAGIAPVRELAGLRLLRPLLTVPKAALTALLAAAGQPWLEDPSNRAAAFARARLRRDADLDVAGLVRLACGIRRGPGRARSCGRRLAGAAWAHLRGGFRRPGAAGARRGAARDRPARLAADAARSRRQALSAPPGAAAAAARRAARRPRRARTHAWRLPGSAARRACC